MNGNLFSSGIVYYAADKQNPFTITMRIEATDPVDGNSLREAVSKTWQRYPCLRVRVIKSVMGLKIEDNDLPWTVTEGALCPPIGSEGVNYHLIAFTWSGNNIMIHTFHGLIDGIAFNKLFKTLMFYYSEIRYNVQLNPEGINTLEDDISAEEYTDPFPKRRPERKLSPLAKTPRFVKALKITKESGIKERDPHIFRISVPRSSLNGVMTGLDVSPAPFLGIMMAKAILQVHPDSGRKVSIAIPINIRPALNANKYCMNLVYNLHVICDDKIVSLPPDRQCTSVRGRVFLQSDTDSVLKELDFQRKVFSLISHIPFYGLKRLISRLSMSFNMSDETFASSYTGKAQFGEMERYFKNIEVICDTCGEDLLVEMFLISDTYNITILQRNGDRRYADAFAGLLRQAGADVEGASSEKLIIPEIGFK